MDPSAAGAAPPADHAARMAGTARLTIHRQSGLSLLEVLVVLGVLAALAALAAPNLSGFLDRGKQRAYEADRAMLQAAVDSWRTDVALRAATPWPILEGATPCLGTVDAGDGSLTVPGCNPYLDIAALADQGFVRSANAVGSADTARNTSAANASPGSYGWYLDADGLVTTHPAFQPGRYP